MTGDALAWYQWLYNSGLLTSWEEFKHALETCFRPSSFENHHQALFKLQQKSTVSDYQKEFERLCNRVIGLPATAILDCFISGLKPEIQHDMAILQPASISQAIGLAKLIESKHLASRALQPPPRSYQPKYNPSPQPLSTLPPLLPAPNQRLALPTPPKPTSFPNKYLSPTEMLACKVKGLCYNCDERFVPGHRCKTQQFFLLLTEEPEANLPTEPPPEPSQSYILQEPSPPPMAPNFLAIQHSPIPDHTDTPPPTTTHDSVPLSLHAMTGQSSPKTLCFQGIIHGHAVSVLVDTGALIILSNLALLHFWACLSLHFLLFR